MGGIAVAAIVGIVVGLAVAWVILGARFRNQLLQRQADLERHRAEAMEKRDQILRNAEVEAQKKLLEVMNRFERETAQVRDELKEAERRLAKREDNLDKKLDVLNTKEKKLEDGNQRLADAEKDVAATRTKVNEVLAEQRAALLRVAKMTSEEARTLCLKRIEVEVEKEAGELIERVLTAAQENAREKARQITIDAIQRYAAEHTCDATVATVDVPSDDMKGRIIGREGRNIRAFEKATGATIVVDDTPGVVTINVFDPVRKEIARLSLERLIKDGRIHPTRIEELVAETEKEIEQRVVEYGRQATVEANVHGVNKKITDLLGRLQYRTSYGQNVLKHSIEVAHLCGVMADELGLDGSLARRCGLLHDIGKAFPSEQEGTHTQLGAEFVRKLNEHAAVVNAVEGHHGDVAAATPYTPLVMAADAISASRGGARRDSLERYIKRLQDLEAAATSFEGVRQAYAVEAGREVRVIVDAARVDDRSSLKLARDIANKIQDSMTFPGEIRVTVLREIRAVEYAR
ncbi:MAG: ribonuclease Y [Planctomycetes bacterium]|nr:ribonuclease Y [Planctomycetota bacterium]